MAQKSKEANLQKRDPELSLRKLARVYNVCDRTPKRRVDGSGPSHVTNLKSRNLTMSEEETIAKRILELDARAFPPRLRYVQEMANILRRERVLRPVTTIAKEAWSRNCSQRTPCTKYTSSCWVRDTTGLVSLDIVY
ncbi:hypothetical protein ANO14919_062950 [Xylariales sp. No.14919]|nr:hypothetical protein ANO14919_062950 [Xylariales sp. No.14919]